jgi:hypothetical protein
MNLCITSATQYPGPSEVPSTLDVPAHCTPFAIATYTRQETSGKCAFCSGALVGCASPALTLPLVEASTQFVVVNSA